MFSMPTASEIASFAVLFIGGLFALSQFRHGQKVKAAEFLLNLEKEYAPLMKTLLRVEYDDDYRKWLMVPVTKQVVSPTMALTETESKAIDDLETVLRFFFTSRMIKELGVDGGFIERMNAYYLRKLRSRLEIEKYLEMYWPALYFWSESVARPFFVRWPIYLRQMPARWRNYRYGSGDHNRRKVAPLPTQLANALHGTPASPSQG